MKKLLILAFTLAVATSAFAQVGTISARYSGTVDNYDAATKTLTINQKERQGVFLITETSEVMQGKTKADPSVFVAGQKIEVEFVMDGAKKLVQKAKVSAPAGK